MRFPTPKNSRKAVNRAGDVLKAMTETPAELMKAYEIVSNWRSCHGYPINTFKITLRRKGAQVDKTVLVAQRLKRFESIIAKLQRYPNMNLAQMQDIGGLRAVVKTVSQLHRLRDIYLGLKHPTFARDLVTRDYTDTPKPSGYRSIHLVYRYKNRGMPDYDGLQIELQLRTKLQHIWATAVETIDTFLQYSLKASRGPEEWLDFFSITGSAFARLKSNPLSQRILGYRNVRRLGQCSTLPMR